MKFAIRKDHMKYPYFILAILLVFGCSERAPIQYELSDKQYKIIQDNTASFPKSTQLAIAILTDSTTNYYGIMISGDTLIKINNRDSVFEIGSISKVFTSTMLASFLLKNKVQLDESIEQYLPL